MTTSVSVALLHTEKAREAWNTSERMGERVSEKHEEDDSTVSECDQAKSDIRSQKP